MLAVSICVFVLDFFVKKFTYGINVAFINNFFGFYYGENVGIAFSLPVPVLASVFLTSILIVGFTYFVFRNFDLNKSFGLVVAGLILGGALGNLYDRIVYGYVRDFISVWKWPSFNIADSAIFCGALALLIFFDKIVLGKNKK
ncbi:MAG: lipoprotein signal peptidase, signal peptidase II [Candidatus Peregrinibacteria bacterium GW2011_GWF2_43_17]|nr:MAG: lipoprotein signal peptidase, signal peptidase II [Candidatus Peregrinibacteria bacterium GW2011_GWF2_43_17]KKT19677.1 MAG: Lipoprotein signal peptidase [Candidatus Peregrinibacteria bacterium GW2011_GWA2_43_8]